MPLETRKTLWLKKINIRGAISEKNKVFKLLKQEGCDKALKIYKEKHKLCKRQITAAKIESETITARESKNNPKMFFNYIYSKKSDIESVRPLSNNLVQW